MTVLHLPVIPDTYTPLIVTVADAVTHWKAIDAGRARWATRVRPDITALLAWEATELLLPQVARAGSVGQALVLCEQTLPTSRPQWQTGLSRLYLRVGADFAARTIDGLTDAFIAGKAGPAPAPGLALPAADGQPAPFWTRVVGDYLGENSGTRIRQIQSTTLATVREVLERGVREGKSIPTIAAEMRARVPEFATSRATTIARTEVIAASNLGARAGAIETRLALDHVWIATPGPRTRPAHAAASGQRKPMEEPFSVGGQQLLFPGDTSQGASAANVVNCRCTVGFVKAARKVAPPQPPKPKPIRSGADARARILTIHDESMAEAVALEKRIGVAQAELDRLSAVRPSLTLAEEAAAREVAVRRLALREEIVTLNGKAAQVIATTKEKIQAEFTRGTRAGKVVFSEKVPPAIQRGADWIGKIFGTKSKLTAAPVPVNLSPVAMREFYFPYNGALHLHRYTATDVAVHEFGHAIENAELFKARAGSFLRRRAGTEPRTLIAGSKDEWAWRDEFYDHYVGKSYDGGVPDTEITSMGLQALYNDPVTFARRDPGHFDFLWDEIILPVRKKRVR